MASRVDAMPGEGAGPQTPETLWQLVKLMAKSLWMNKKGILLSLLIQSAVIMVFVMFMNTFIIVYLNEGYMDLRPVRNPSRLWHYFLRLDMSYPAAPGMEQAEPGGVAGFDALWLLLFLILSELYNRISGQGIKAFVLDLVGAPKWTVRCFSETGRWGLPVLIMAAGVALVLTLFWQNSLFFAVLSITLLLSYTMRDRNVAVLLAQLTWLDLQRLFRRGKPRRQLQAEPLSLAILGGCLGTLSLVFLPAQPHSALLLCAVLVALGVLLSRRIVSARAALFVLGLACAHAVLAQGLQTIHAHDDGWTELGGSLGSLLKSPTAIDLILKGARPGLFAVVGAAMGSLLGAAGSRLGSLGAQLVEAGGLASRVADSLAAAGRTVRDTATYTWDFTRAFAGGVWDDFAGAARTIGGVAVAAYRGGGMLIRDTGRLIGDVYDFGGRSWNDPQVLWDKLDSAYTTTGDAVYSAGRWASDSASAIWNNPWGAAETVGNIASAIGRGIYTTVTDPAKAWQFIKDTAGGTNFQNSWDPNRSLLDRLGQVAIGTVKLYGTIVTAGKIGAAAKTGAAKVSAWCQASGAKGGLLVRRPLSVPVNPGPTYVTSSRPPNLSHLTRQSQRAIQSVADRGYQIHIRYGKEAGVPWLESGRALPKPSGFPKTLDAIDGLIGGPKGREGLAACFRPRLPPKEVMRTLKPELQRAIVQQARMRNPEWVRYGRTLNQGEFRNVGGIIQHRRTGKFFAGDADVLEIRNRFGGPLSALQQNEVTRWLTEARVSNVTHEALSTWHHKASFDPRAAEGMIRKASEGGQGVITFSPNAAPTQSFKVLDAPFHAP